MLWLVLPMEENLSREITVLLSFPTWTCQSGSHKKGRREGPFCHRGGRDQRIHHRHSQVHPRRGFQEARPSGTHRDPGSCQEGDGDAMCVHGHQAPQSCLGHRNKDCPIPQPAARGGGPESVMWMKIHQTRSMACHHFQTCKQLMRVRTSCC